MSDDWISHAQVTSQPQRKHADLGGMDHVYNIWHEPTGIILMTQKPPGEDIVYLGQLGVGPNFTKHYSQQQIDDVIESCGELIESRRNYLKPKKRKKRK